MTARLSECFPASGQMCLHKVPLLWIRYEVWLQEWNGKCFCPEVKAPQTQPGIPLKQLTVGLYTCGCRFSCGAVLPGQAFEFWKASNNNFSKRYRVVHTRSDLSVRRPGLQYPIIVPQTQYLCVFRALYRGKRRTGIMIR